MKVSEIKQYCEVSVEGDSELELTDVQSVTGLKPNSLGFLSEVPVGSLAGLPADSCLFVHEEYAGDFPGTLIRSSNPKFDFAVISNILLKADWPLGVSGSAYISDESDCRASFIGENVVVEKGAEVGESTVLHAGVYVGKNVSIGKCSVLHPGVVVYENSVIGNDCVLNAGAVVGSPGFGYVKHGERIEGFPQAGRAILGDNVDVGANSCIDRGSLEDTIIGDHTKIDNLVQIAHNVSIGKRVRIAAHVGISGSVVIEDDVLIGGQAGIADHVRIEAGAILGARSAVFPGKIVRKGIWAGTPVRPVAEYKRENALIRSLGRLSDEVKRLKQMIK